MPQNLDMLKPNRRPVVDTADREHPRGTFPNLLKPATMGRVQNTTDIVTSVAGKIRVGVSMTEGNTC
ncbi:MAG TPA: hypothetical protein VJU82_14915 [Acidobacteriaceae bacterium]|nr:hypothetical protein [Acidobacteriaceae bacterium]